MGTDISEYANLIACTGTILFMIQMLTPMATFYKVVRTKTVGDLSIAPYNTAYLSCAVWMLYGIIIHDPYVTNTNLYGVCLQLGFTLCYYKYALPSNKIYIVKQIMVTTTIILLSCFYCWAEPDQKVAMQNFGIFCSGVTFAFFAAPFSNLRLVLKEKNAESLPSVLIMFTFVVSLMWMLYGVAINDFALQITNLVGVVLSSIQLFLIAIYRNPNKIRREPLLP